MLADLNQSTPEPDFVSSLNLYHCFFLSKSEETFSQGCRTITALALTFASFVLFLNSEHSLYLLSFQLQFPLYLLLPTITISEGNVSGKEKEEMLKWYFKTISYKNDNTYIFAL